MEPRERAELIKEATFDDWMRRPKGKTFLDKERDNLRLEIRKAPDFIYNREDQVVGVDAWVRLFEGDKELPIDPHRRIINPPTVPRKNVRLVSAGVDNLGQPVFRREVTQDPVGAFYETVWDSVIGTPNVKGWRTRGTVTTVFGIADDGYVTSSSSSYSPARSGTNLSVVTSSGNNNQVGQTKNAGFNYFCQESFIGFDTSAINDGDTVSAVTLECWLESDSSTVDFTVEARERDWGGTLTTSAWVAGESLGGLPLFATLNTNGIGSTGAYKTFTSQASFLTATNLKTGTVYITLTSSRHRNGDTPSDGVSESVAFRDADATGTTQDPKLTITHEAAPKAMPFFTSRPNRIWRLG